MILCLNHNDLGTVTIPDAELTTDKKKLQKKYPLFMWIPVLCIVPWDTTFCSMVFGRRKKKIREACENISVTLAYEGGVQKVLLNGEDISDQIRQEEVGEYGICYQWLWICTCKTFKSSAGYGSTVRCYYGWT